MPPKWRSPLLPPTADRAADAQAPTNDAVCSAGAKEKSQDATDADDADADVVVVPKAGLYGLCFGNPGSPFETPLDDLVPSAIRDEDKTCEVGTGPSTADIDACQDDGPPSSRRALGRGTKRSLSQTASRTDREASYCGCTCRAEFRTNIDSSEEECSVVCVDLPLPAGKRNVVGIRCSSGADAAADEASSGPTCTDGKTPPRGGFVSVTSVLTSTRIGRIARLPARTRVRVRYTNISPNCRKGIVDRDDDDDSAINTASSYSADPARRPIVTRHCPLKWCLVLHREDGDSVERSEGGGGGGEQNSNRPVAVRRNTRVDWYPIDEVGGKSFLCGECGRRYPTTKAVQLHALSVHVANANRENSSSPEGGGGISSCRAIAGPTVLRRPLSVAFEDGEMVVVVKPQGVSVMGERWSLQRSDLFLAFKASPDCDRPLTKPRIAHRLDSPTGGLLVIAKTKPVEVELKKCFASRACRKRYRAIVFGRLEPEPLPGGEVDGRIDQSSNEGPTSVKYSGVCDSPVDGKPSVTRYNVVCHTRCSHPRANGWITTVDLFPVTGRRHQLRVHMASLGFAIWGDRIYGPYTPRAGAEPGDDRYQPMNSKTSEVMLSATDDDLGLLDSATASEHPHLKLCLWALEIAFPHPTSEEELKVCIDEPSWFKELRDSQEQRWSQMEKQESK